MRRLWHFNLLPFGELLTNSGVYKLDAWATKLDKHFFLVVEVDKSMNWFYFVNIFTIHPTSMRRQCNFQLLHFFFFSSNNHWQSYMFGYLNEFCFFFHWSKENEYDEETEYICISSCIASMEQEQDSYLDGEIWFKLHFMLYPLVFLENVFSKLKVDVV